MRFSYSWLKDFLPELTATPEQVAETLTSHSFETVVAGRLAVDPQILVAKIVKLEPHPNADRLRLATVETGAGEVTVVCGAPNIQVGDVVPFSPPGTTLVDGEGGRFVLKPATIRGVESPGMLNSPQELGLAAWHGGIYLLPPETPIGSRLADHLPADTILEADITPNRAHDCLSHRGVARELAALWQLTVREQSTASLPTTSLTDWTVSIENPDDTRRYVAVHVTGVQVKPSPLWLQARLWAVGARPINNVVDITNYVMYELGNPLHAFDAARLPQRSLQIRRAQAHEQLTTLDDQVRRLSPEQLVIATGDEPIAVAGVMGGHGSEVTESTAELLLEVASFRPYLVQTAAQALGLTTESSRRFSKGITPAVVGEAAARAVQLLGEQAGAMAVGVMDEYPRHAQAPVVSFRPERVSAMAGMTVPLPQTRAVLTQLRCEVAGEGAVWQVVPPIERLDLLGEQDLIEEVVRVVGLHEIPVQVPVAPPAPARLPVLVQWREQVRDVLVASGLSESYGYSFEDDTFAQWYGLPVGDERVELSNPVAPEQRFLRRRLLPGLVHQVLANKAEFLKPMGAPERALFEIGTVFQVGAGGVVSGVVEREHVAGVLVGERARQMQVDEIVSGVLQQFGITKLAEHSGELMVFDRSHALVRKLGMPVAVFELNLTVLQQAATREPAWQPTLVTEQQPVAYTAPSPYPPVFRDISLLVEPGLTVERVREVLERAGGTLLVDVELFDEYQPDGTAQKSLAFHLMYQSFERTLTTDEVDVLHTAVIAALTDELHAEVRE